MENYENDVLEPTSQSAPAWWENEPGKKRAERCAVAYYRHSAQNKQKNSIALQAAQVRAVANQKALHIIEEYEDRGFSGLTADRPGFQRLLAAARSRNDFKYILVLDMSRWGRFSDTNESAMYQAQCRQNGKEVVFVTQDYSSAGPFGNLMMEVHRILSFEESSIKSDKVFRGSVKISKQGFRAGAQAPYGFVRAEYDESGKFRQVLSDGDGKNLSNNRVKLMPADNEGPKVVNAIFSHFVHDMMSETQIASSLNNGNIPSPSGKSWRSNSVRRILSDPQYTGAAVYNRTSQKLHTRRVKNPREEWVVTPNAFDGIISEDLFRLAHERLESRLRRFTPEILLSHLRRLYDRFGIVTGKMIDHDEQSPKASIYTRNFGSVSNAIQKLFSDVVDKAKQDVANRIASEVTASEEYKDFIVLDQKLTVLVQPVIPLRTGYTQSWYFKPDSRPVVDITLGVALSGSEASTILGYFSFPRLMLGGQNIKLSSSSDGVFELHAAMGIDFIRGILT